jgi:hypothetical protein
MRLFSQRRLAVIAVDEARGDRRLSAAAWFARLLAGRFRVRQPTVQPADEVDGLVTIGAVLMALRSISNVPSRLCAKIVAGIGWRACAADRPLPVDGL